MHPDERNREQLNSIIKNIEKTERYQKDLEGSYEAFIQNENYQDLCSFALVQIGEAVGRLSKEFKLDHPEVSWEAIYGMRCFLVHGYENSSMKLVWEAVVHDLPGLKEFCINEREELP